MNKIKILFLAANPLEDNKLKLDEEVRAITQKIRASEHRDSLELIPALAVRPDDLLQLLNEHQPHIVHFSGHGNSREIILADESGLSKRVDIKTLKALITTLKDNIKCIIFNSCYSKETAEILTEIIDCSIGMNSSVGDEAAIIFAASFYRAVGFARSAQEAFEQGIAALLLEGITEDSIPEILVKDGIDPSQVFF